MNKIDNLAKIIKAFQEEQMIEYKCILSGVDPKWEDIKDSRLFEQSIADYIDGNVDLRIKQEPRVIWVNIYDSGEIFACKSKSDAKSASDYSCECVRFIEDQN
jgi:hypothetical protein